ncbi:TetR/AcrR family transcriptional regulator [Phenylobacterium aquaticum]|uniref:TetR/AcrR family transcriptional regulator n=1 Tax=Phenylobacterium aquaticum TaxID=1763816 RepID=UPI001F5CFA9D|nr:TetR/AcrR family transcriptional regulator [Phenylobacterium aquaticum]MCI3133961.1 TetR/AcrR family transcriptional regulator [Phenylobacterium aquaticum]
MAVRPKTRRTPVQSRAKAACAAIFEATTRILETEGEAALNTNRIAELAGVSIGTLYQYFPDKRAILLAMAREEREAWQARARAAIKEEGASPLRAHIRALIHGFAGRPVTRRVTLKVILEDESPRQVAPAIDRSIEDFVRTRAMFGVVRAAVLEDYPLLHHPAFENALVRMVEGA